MMEVWKGLTIKKLHADETMKLCVLFLIQRISCPLRRIDVSNMGASCLSDFQNSEDVVRVQGGASIPDISFHRCVSQGVTHPHPFH
jgi:hypothetical protein